MFARVRLTALLVILIGAIAWPLQATRAADPPRLSRLSIRLWPEFDRPGVLVFLVGQTAEGVALPAELKFTIPAGSTVNAVAYIDTTRNVLTDQVPQSVDGQNVSITTPNGNFHIEFYDPALTIDGTARTYTYTWQQAMAVDQLIWQIEQPLGATGFGVQPTTGTLGTDENGLPAYELDGGAVAPDVASAVTVKYSKADNTLTRDGLAALAGQATQAPASTGSGQAGDNSASIIIAAVVLLLAAGLSAIMYFRGAKGAGSRFGVRVVPAAGEAARKGGQKAAAGMRFCPQCGQPAKPADQFCRKCGTKLRK